MERICTFFRGSKADHTHHAHTLLLRRNPAFVDRKEELETLFKLFTEKASEDGPTSCAIRGIGGVGKTQAAIEFTHRYRSHYDAVFWTRAGEEIELHRSFGAIGRRLKLFDTDDIDQPKLERVQDWLQMTGEQSGAQHLLPNANFVKEKSWLLVFDNVTDWDNISPFLPTSSKASRTSIIVTTQKSSEWSLNHALQLEPFDKEIGSDLLLRQLKSPPSSKDCAADREKAREISDLVGGLPLWLGQVSGYINLARCTLAEYIAIHMASSDLLGGRNKGSNEWTYERAVETTFDITMKELSEDSTDLLFMLAFLNSDNIREDLVLQDYHTPELAFLHVSNKTRYA